MILHDLEIFGTKKKISQRLELSCIKDDNAIQRINCYPADRDLSCG